MKKSIDKSKLRKISTISQTIANRLGIPAGTIYITDGALKHINRRHGPEISKLGLTAYAFARCVFMSYNQIRRGDKGSLLFVDYAEKLPRVAAVRMEYYKEGSFWIVKTAFPANRSYVDGKELLYQK